MILEIIPRINSDIWIMLVRQIGPKLIRHFRELSKYSTKRFNKETWFCLLYMLTLINFIKNAIARKIAIICVVEIDVWMRTQNQQRPSATHRQQSFLVWFELSQGFSSYSRKWSKTKISVTLTLTPDPKINRDHIYVIEVVKLWCWNE